MLMRTAERHRPARFKRAARRASVEVLLDRTSQLARERQSMRQRGASPAALERNRVALARAQWQLSHALIERYRPNAA